MSSSRKRGPGRPAKYPPEFQRDAVAMVLDEGRAISDVARAIGVNEGTLGNWVNQARAARECRGELAKDDYEELKRLRRENVRLKQERDLLKRAAAFFAADQ